MLQTETATRWVIQLDSLSEVASYLAATPRRWRQDGSRSNSARESWDLGLGYDGALELAVTGWEEGVKNISALAAAVPNNVIITREYGIAGDTPDVPRYLAGDPFNMVHRGRKRVPKPAMTIVVNVVASGGVKGSEMANYGAAMVALIDRLESRHIRVELIAAIAVDLDRKSMAASWTVKRAEDHLDLAAIAFSLAHPGCFRRFGFGLIERAPRAIERQAYGYPGQIKASDLLDCPADALLIDGCGSNIGACRTMEGALALAKAQINRAAGADIAELEDLDG